MKTSPGQTISRVRFIGGFAVVSVLCVWWLFDTEPKTKPVENRDQTQSSTAPYAPSSTRTGSETLEALMIEDGTYLVEPDPALLDVFDTCFVGPSEPVEDPIHAEQMRRDRRRDFKPKTTPP